MALAEFQNTNLAASGKPNFKRVAQCLYRNPANNIYYALVKKRGKQHRKPLKTSDRQLAERRLIEFSLLKPTDFAKFHGWLAVNGHVFDFCSFAWPLQMIYGISPAHIVEFRQGEISHFYRRASRQAIRVFLDVVNAIDQAWKEIPVIPRTAGAYLTFQEINSVKNTGRPTFTQLEIC